MGEEYVIVLALALLLAVNIWTKLKEIEQDRRLAEYQNILIRQMRVVNKMLVCWAEHWGEPTEHVKAKLIEIMKDDH